MLTVSEQTNGNLEGVQCDANWEQHKCEGCDPQVKGTVNVIHHLELLGVGEDSDDEDEHGSRRG